MTDLTLMRAEITEIPEAVARFLETGAPAMVEAGAALAAADPVMIATIARGSSDHAAAFIKYGIELTAGVPVASIGPSIASIYGRQLRMANCAAIGISQSGMSPDIVAMTESARDQGAVTVAVTNTGTSPLARAADFTLDLNAGAEKSVAATKTFVSSIVAGLGLLAHWQGDGALKAALADLPRALSKAIDCDWSSLVEALDGHQSLYVLGRGPALAIAGEAALKFKETSAIHAEAYSAAEVMHGPARIVDAGFPVLVLAARDAALPSVIAATQKLDGQGAQTFITAEDGVPAHQLPFVATGHPITDALALIVSFYGFVEVLSRHRGFNPDTPPYLKKVTETR